MTTVKATEPAKQLSMNKWVESGRKGWIIRNTLHPSGRVVKESKKGQPEKK
jgi:hypothetical protein